MRSGQTPARSKILASSNPLKDEVYDLKGLNLVAPDQVMPDGETGFTINSRRFADNESETSVAMRTRQGSIRFSTPVGEILDTQNTETITGDTLVDTERIVAIPFTAGTSGALTKYDLTIKKSLNTRGAVIIEIYTSRLGLPNTLIGQTSIAPSLITGSYLSVASYLIDAPAIEEDEEYWAVVKMQELGVGSYNLAATAGSGIQVSSDDQKTWTFYTGSARFKTYTSEDGLVKGFTKRYPQSGDNITLFGLGTSIYKLPDNPAIPEVLDTISVDSTRVRFTNVDDWTFWADSEGNARRWNGTDAPSDIPNVPPDNGVPNNLLVLENRLLVVPKDDPTRVDFSALFDWETWPEVNFFYIGRPKSPDHITAWHEFRQGATVFTKEMKYTLLGSDIQTFEPTPHVGTKGAVSQEATARGKEAIYFMADDRHIYSWNGSVDKQISFKVGPELRKILDVDKVRLHLYKNQLRIYYNKTPNVDVTYMLLYDIEQDQWFRDTGRPVMGSMEWTFDENQLVEFSSRAGALYFGEETYSDMGKAIDFKYHTVRKLYGSGASKKRVKRFRPVVRPTESSYYLSVGKDMDYQDRPNMRPWLVDGGGAKWGTFNWGDGTKYGSSNLVDNTAAMSGRGRHIQYRFEHNGIDQPVNLYGYIALIKVGRPR